MHRGILDEALKVLGDLLTDRGQEFDLAVVGGGALLLLGLIERPTKDLDVIGRYDQGRLVRADRCPRRWRARPGTLLEPWTWRMTG
jgi:hypothetical protein